MTFSRCTRCGESFNSSKRDQHRCRYPEETTDE